MLSFLFPLAFAQDADPVPVLVSSLQARNESATKLAALIEGFLAQRLAGEPTLRVMRVEDTPPFQDYSARIYMDSCPVGDIVGCTLLLGERGEAAWAVTGTVQALVAGTRVDIDIIDIEGSRVAVSFTSELDSGRDEAFAEGVAKVLVAAIAGEIGRETDIRISGEEDEEELDPADKAAVARELQQLAKELGSFDVVIRRTNIQVERSSFTADDLAERMETDAQKPWERLEMSPDEYLRYKNSGLQLFEWRRRALGRKLQLLIRAGGGFFNGPIDGRYYGRKVNNATTLSAEDVYVEESVESGSGGVGAVGVAFGVHPLVDVGVFGGAAAGNYHHRINTTEIVGQEHGEAWDDEGEEPNASYFAGGEVTVAPLPTFRVRPIVGIGGMWMRGSVISDHVEASDFNLPTFEATNMVLAHAFVGGEADLSPQISAFLKLPVTVLVAGDTVQAQRDTPGAEPVLEDLETSDGAAPVGVMLVAGLQVRLFGAKPRETSLLDEVDE